MPNRKQLAFDAYRDAEQAYLEAAGHFTQEMDMAVNSGADWPGEPWNLCIGFFKRMRELKRERDQRRAEFAAVVLYPHETERPSE